MAIRESWVYSDTRCVKAKDYVWIKEKGNRFERSLAQSRCNCDKCKQKRLNKFNVEVKHD